MKVFISNKEIEEIASGLIHVACGHQESGQIDIDSIARFLGLFCTSRSWRKTWTRLVSCRMVRILYM